MSDLIPADAFKTYVHKRLDDAGVPVDPESPHKAEGCRIGGRLDVLIGERDELRKQLAELRTVIAGQSDANRDAPATASTCRDCEGEGGRAIDSSGMVHPGECGGCGASYPQSLCDRDNADIATPAVAASDQAHKYHEALRRIWSAVDEAKRFDCVDQQFEKNLLAIIKGSGITDPRFGLYISDKPTVAPVITNQPDAPMRLIMETTLCGFAISRAGELSLIFNKPSVAPNVRLGSRVRLLEMAP